jgi:hypothetical protein
MADTNPLQKYFRQPALYIKLPTGGKWYDQSDIETVEQELAVYGLTAIDEIMLNTPDAMLNGQSLEKVIKHCVPGVKNVKALMLPDLDAIFLAIKIATTKGKYEFDRQCDKCKHENNFEVNCQHLIDQMSYIEDSDTLVNFDDTLVVSVKPYSFELRQLFLMREMEEQRTLSAIDENNKNMNDIEKAKLLGESVERLSKMTFDLVARSISSISMTKENIEVSDTKHISEWLVSVGKMQAEAVIAAVNNLNRVGITKTIPAQCTECGNEWVEALNFDPVSFFAQR